MSYERIETRQLRRRTAFADVLYSSVSVYRLNCNYANLHNTLTAVVEDALDASSVHGEDWIQVVVDSEGFRKPVIVNQHYEKRNNFNFKGLETHLERVDQSNSGNALARGLEVTIYHLVRPHGKGKRVNEDTNIAVNKRIRRPGWRSVLIDDNTDCFISCIVYRMREVDELNGRKERDNILYQGKLKSWIKPNVERYHRVASFKTKCGFIGDINYGPEQWRISAEVLRRIGPFRLIVYNVDGDVLFMAPFASDEEAEIPLLLFDSHYFITRTTHFGRKKFCIYCRAIFDNDHLCSTRCEFCANSECLNSEIKERQCENCRRLFRNDICYLSHLKENKCVGKPTCELCLRSIQPKGEHDCRFFNCRTCHQKVEPGHECFMTPLNRSQLEKSDRRRRIYGFYDFETAAVPVERSPSNPLPKPGVSQHVPVLAVLYVVCNLCWEGKEPANQCDFCLQHRKVFVGTSAGDDLVEFIFKDLKNSYPRGTEMIFFGHNAQRFDIHFIIESIIDNRHILPKTILRKGNSIFELGFKNIRFLDSLRFMPMPLRKFPKAWSIPNVVKGWFPHKSTPADIQTEPVLLCIPPPDDFYTDNMKQEEYDEFISWYEGVEKDKPYDLLKNMILYCKDDVRVLMYGVMLFRDMWIEIYGIDPFVRNSTLPAAVIEAYRCCCLTKQTVPITPYHTYGKEGRASCEESAVLDWLENEHSITIQRQVNLGNVFYFDGLSIDENGNKTIWEYNSCFWHGCSGCYPNIKNTDGPKKIVAFTDQDGTSREEVIYSIFHTKQRDLRKKALIESMSGYNLRIIWTHDITDNISARTFVDEHRSKYMKRRKIPVIRHRDVLSGGRTEDFYTFYECQSDEVISYYDINGLYPHVLMTHRYPTCHPIHLFDFPDSKLNEYFSEQHFFGLIDCVIEAPRNLLIPVLQVKINGKLLFPLCATCARLENIGQCRHDLLERQLSNVWYTGTVEYAITKGYIIRKINSIEHYPKSESGDRNPFHKFISDCMVRKRIAEGDPANGIPANICMRTLNKLIANSFWGSLRIIRRKMK